MFDPEVACIFCHRFLLRIRLFSLSISQFFLVRVERVLDTTKLGEFLLERLNI